MSDLSSTTDSDILVPPEEEATAIGREDAKHFRVSNILLYPPSHTSENDLEHIPAEDVEMLNISARAGKAELSYVNRVSGERKGVHIDKLFATRLGADALDVHSEIDGLMQFKLDHARNFDAFKASTTRMFTLTESQVKTAYEQASSLIEKNSSDLRTLALEVGSSEERFDGKLRNRDAAIETNARGVQSLTLEQAVLQNKLSSLNELLEQDQQRQDNELSDAKTSMSDDIRRVEESLHEVEANLGNIGRENKRNLDELNAAFNLHKESVQELVDRLAGVGPDTLRTLRDLETILNNEGGVVNIMLRMLDQMEIIHRELSEVSGRSSSYKKRIYNRMVRALS